MDPLRIFCFGKISILFVLAFHFGALTSASAAWVIRMTHDSAPVYFKKEDVYLSLGWDGTQPAPPAPSFSIMDQNGRILTHLIPIQEKQKWVVKIPTERLGYFELKPTLAETELIPPVGSRPAGRLTFAVVNRPDAQSNFQFGNAFLSSQGTTLLQGAKSEGWDLLPFLGVRAQGANYSWARFEPSMPDTLLNALQKDSWPESFRNAGLMPYFHLNVLPSWAVDMSRLPEGLRTGQGTTRLPPKNWQAWRGYLTKIVNHLSQAYSFVPQRVYEVMWEPVIPWGWNGTREDIVKMFQIAHEVVRLRDPKGLIAGPTLGSLDDIPEFELLMEKGLGKYLDVVSFHSYVTYPPEKADIPGKLQRIREITRKYAGRDLPLMGTECGWTDDAVGGICNQAYALTAALLIYKGEGLKLFTVFYMADFRPNARYGLCYNLMPGLPFGPARISPKPAFPMLRAAVEQVGSAVALGRISGLDEDIWGYAFRSKANGELIAALWDASGKNRKIDFRTGVKQVTVADAFGNTEQRATTSGKIELTLGRGPTYVRGLSAGDYGALGNGSIPANSHP